VVENITSASLLHRRMGHLGVVKIIGAAAAGIIKLNGVTRASLTTACTACVVCRIANAMRRVPKSALRERSEKPLSLVHVDICGPFATSIDGYQYVMALRCDSTRWTAATFLKARGDAGDALTSLLHDLRDELGRHSARPGAAAVRHQVGVFQCDNAKEFTSQTGKFAKAVRAAGGTMRFSSAYHHEQQGIIERPWQTLQAMTRATLLAADIDASWWTHAMRHAVYLTNRLPVDGGLSPYQAITGNAPDLSNVRTFGCRSYVYTDPSRRRPTTVQPLVAGAGVSNKLSNRSRACRYVGEAVDSSAKLHVPLNNLKIVVRSDIATYDERSVTSGLARSSPARAAFDVVPPPDMLDHALVDFTIVRHRTMRRRDAAAPDGDVADELIAIFFVKSTAYPHGVWSEPSFLVDTNAAKYAALTQYLKDVSNTANPHYPLFSFGTYRPPNAPARQIARPCIVLGIDLRNTDGFEALVAIQPGKSDDYTLLDVPRSHVRVAPSPQLAAFSATIDGLDPLPFFVIPAFALGAAQDEVVIGEEAPTRTPRTAAQAWQTPRWRDASLREIKTLEDKETFTYIEYDEIPEGHTPLMCQFKYTVKHDEDGNVIKYKARLIAHGMCQEYQTQYKETFAATSQVTSVITFLKYAVQAGLTVMQADVQAAFVNATLQE
jgi:hypothetical protein